MSEFTNTLGGGTGVSVALETPTGDVDGVNDEFVCSGSPIAVFLRGLVRKAGVGADYTVSVNTITFNAGKLPQTGDELQVLV